MFFESVFWQFIGGVEFRSLRRCWIARRDCFEAPVDKWIDGLKPGHAEDHGMDANGGDKKGVCVWDASDSEVERNLTIRMGEDPSISEADFDRGAGLRSETQARH